MSTIEIELEKLWRQGDLSGFSKLYDVSENLGSETHFLAVLVHQDMLRWDKLKYTLDLLASGGQEEVSKKAKMMLEMVDLAESAQSRKAEERLLAQCDDVARSESDNELGFFAELLRIRVEKTMISLGITSALEKPKLLEHGFGLIKKGATPFPKEAFELLILLMNFSLGIPLADPRKCLEIQEMGRELLGDQPIPLHWFEATLIEAEARLNLEFYQREACKPDALPIVLLQMLERDEARDHTCAESMFDAIYGIHLLRLDYVEGIHWLVKSLPVLWQYGHFRLVKRLKGECIGWVDQRGQTNLSKELKAQWDFINSPSNLPFEGFLGDLNLSHQYFSRGNFFQGKKVVEDQLANTESEIIRSQLINLLVNSASRLQVENHELIDLIAAQREKWSNVGHTQFLAQAYQFGAILQPSRAIEYFTNSARVYFSLGMYEDGIDQVFNRLFIEVRLRLQGEEPELISAEMEELVAQVESIIRGDQMLKSPLTLQAKLHQAVGQAYFHGNLDDQALVFFEQADAFFKLAHHRLGRAMNANHHVLLLIRRAKATRNLNEYDKAVALAKEALPVFREAGLFDFEWRMAWHMALALAEPINFGLVSDTDQLKNRFQEAKMYYQSAESSTTRIFGNTRNMIRSDMLMASITFNKEVRQLIFSGFYFFFYQRHPIDALEWLEKTRARTLTASLNYGLYPSEEHDLLKEETRLNTQLENASDYQAVLQCEQQQMALYESMREVPELSDYAQLQRGQLKLFREIQARLKLKNRAEGKRNFILYFYTHSQEIYAFGIDAEQECPQIKRIPINANLMRKIVEEDFEDLLRNCDYTQEKESVWTDFNALIQPLSQWTQPGDVISIIPFGFLQGLPLHCLRLEGAPLICRNPISYNFSLWSWLYLSNGNSSLSFDKVAVFGDPSESLAHSASEAISVADCFGIKALNDKEVTKSVFLQSLKEADWVHFAGHGEFGKQGTGFDTSVVELMDDYVSASELMDLDSAAQLVVLSACDTARHIRHEGDEHIGLVTALLSSGVKTVIAGLWKLIDEDAKDFFDLFYPKVKEGVPPIVAMQQSMIALMEDKDNFFRWGGLALYGHF